MKTHHGKKGFTLAELLIVAAIIAVLVGVSIPVFSTQLAKSRLAANQANARAAKSAALETFMSEPPAEAINSAIVYYEYSVSDGKLTYAGIYCDANWAVGTGPIDSFTYDKDISGWTVNTDAVNIYTGNKSTLGKAVFSKWYVAVCRQASVDKTSIGSGVGEVIGYYADQK
jgi:prepilin-type N-terminal cleavage/methylation domain-containing protein